MKHTYLKGPLVSPEMVLERTSAALRLKSSIVARICQRWGNQIANGKANGNPWSSTTHTRYHPLRIDAIKNFVNMYYRTDSTASMTKAHDKLIRSGLFRGSQTTLRRMLQREGFDFVRTGSRCDTFKRVTPEFIFEEYSKPDKEEEDVEALEKKLKLEPLNPLACEKEDLEFFRSVLPSVAKLNDTDKLNFRLAVMNKVHHILYEPPEKSKPDETAMEVTVTPNDVEVMATETPKVVEEMSTETPKVVEEMPTETPKVVEEMPAETPKIVETITMKPDDVEVTPKVHVVPDPLASDQ